MSGTNAYLPRDYGPPVPGHAGITATGTTYADAFPIMKKITVFNVVPAGAGCSLPTAFEPNSHLEILNRGLNDMLVYPSKGDQIEGYGVDQPVVIGAGGSARFWSDAPSTITPKPRTWWLTP